MGAVRSVVLILGIFSVGTGSAFAQHDYLWHRYLPLDVGNSWHYTNDINQRGITVSVTGTTVVNDTTYYVLENGYMLHGDTLRIDEEGNVWDRLHGRDTFLFGFGLASDETYEYELPCNGCEFIVEVDRISEYEFFDQLYSDVIKLVFNPLQGVDIGSWNYFVPDLGMLWNGYPAGPSAFLSWAVVDGSHISVSADVQPVVDIDRTIDVYPNPFRSRSTVTVLRGGASVPNLRLIDMHGRVLQEPTPSSCSAQSCMFSIESRGLSSGVYLLRVQAETYSRSSSVVFVN